jgi:hypothetical protein
VESVSCFVRVVVGSLRDHTAHMNSLSFQTALSSCDCRLTAVCADARLCEQLLPASARSHTLPDLTHCPERSEVYRGRLLFATQNERDDRQTRKIFATACSTLRAPLQRPLPTRRPSPTQAQLGTEIAPRPSPGGPPGQLFSARCAAPRPPPEREDARMDGGGEGSSSVEATAAPSGGTEGHVAASPGMVPSSSSVVPGTTGPMPAWAVPGAFDLVDGFYPCP